jgi:hypothetical protein
MTAASRRNEPRRLPTAKARRSAAASTSMSPSGYAIETLLASGESVASWTYGSIRKIQDRSAMPAVMMTASSTPTRSPSGLRRRAASSTPTIRHGYTRM